MAIFEDVPGLSVGIVVDGKPAAEYDDNEVGSVDNVSEHKASVTTSKYIESISDKTYSVEVKADAAFDFNYPSLLCRVIIDGKTKTGKIITRKFKRVVIEGFEKYVAGGCATLHKFKFDINENDVQNIQEDSEHVSKLGEIVVELSRGSEPIFPPENKLPRLPEAKLPDVVNVNEKEMKVTPVANAMPHFIVNSLDGKDRPFAIFRFKYRSRDALKQLQVLPLDPLNPKCLEMEPLLALQRENYLRLMEKQSHYDDLPAPVERECEEGGNDESSQKKSKSGEDVTIDLSDESEED